MGRGATFIRSSVPPDTLRLIDTTSKCAPDVAGGGSGRCADASDENIARPIANPLNPLNLLNLLIAQRLYRIQPRGAQRWQE